MSGYFWLLHENKSERSYGSFNEAGFGLSVGQVDGTSQI